MTGSREGSTNMHEEFAEFQFVEHRYTRSQEADKFHVEETVNRNFKPKFYVTLCLETTNCKNFTNRTLENLVKITFKLKSVFRVFC